MAWYDKYMIDDQTELEKREEMFRQHMRELKELDKYERKKERYERLRNRRPKKRRSRRRRRRVSNQVLQRSASGDKKKAQWIAKMGGPHAARHREYHPGSMTPVQVGMSGAPQFASLASMGYKSPGQMGFKGYTGQPNYRYTPPGASGRGRQRRREKTKEGRQAPRAWAERQESLGRPSDYGTYLADRRLRMSTGLQDPMGSAISAGQQAAGMVGQGIDRINPNKPGNIFHSAGQWLGGMAPSGPRPLLDPIRSGGGLVPADRPKPTLPPGPRPKPPTSSHGIGVGGFLPASPPPPPPSNFYPDASTAPPALPWETPVELPPGTTYEDIRPPKRTSLPDDHPLLAPDPVMPWLRQMYGAAGEDLKDKWGRIYDLFAQNYSW